MRRGSRQRYMKKYRPRPDFQKYTFRTDFLRSGAREMIISLKNFVAVVPGENSAEQKNSGKMSDNCLGVQERHNSSHGDPERSQSSPCLHSEPKPLLALPSLAASHGAGWPSVVHLGSPKRNKHTNERAIPQKGQFSPRPPAYLLPSVCFSADGFGPLSPPIPRRSSRGSVLIFIFKRPVIPSILISLPLRHPVSVSLETEEVSSQTRPT